LDREMQTPLRRPTLCQKHTYSSLGGHCRGGHGHVESYQISNTNKDPSTQTRIDLDFRKEWLHMSILGKDCATIRWHFLPPLYYLNYLNDWRGWCLPPRMGFILFAARRGGYIQMAQILGTPEMESRNCPCWNPGTLDGHNSRLQSPIAIEPKL
jgi:hypothetical protein